MIIINGWKCTALLVVSSVVALLIMKLGALGLGILVLGILLTAGGFYINKPEADAEGNLRKPRNGIFWIPIQYWGMVFIVLSFVGFAQGK